ncbi:MAG: alpha/beta fold hydrolase [Gammaproteobacteria bacterium]|nr:alpha/beta fold hydrolase [Gammaproteobacteria bacterium]NKB64222.1 alpha/beta fold hydrolase [Gammaproteobacteria bacterium]
MPTALTLHYDSYTQYAQPAQHAPLDSESQSNGPLIILHGLFGSSSNWRSIARRLSSNRTVICLDLRNHGQSPWSDEMDYESMALDVAHLIQQHQLRNPILLGHSMGGGKLQ